MKKTKQITVKLVSIKLKEEDLLYPENFIKRLGGVRKARVYLLDIIDRYFNSEYIDREL